MQFRVRPERKNTGDRKKCKLIITYELHFPISSLSIMLLFLLQSHKAVDIFKEKHVSNVPSERRYISKRPYRWFARISKNWLG